MALSNKIPTIRSATNSGATLRIGDIKALTKGKQTDKDGKPISDDGATAKGDKASAEKNGTETSVDTKIKNLMKSVQKALTPDDKNTDPNAPINSEKDPSRFDSIAGKKFANGAGDAAKNFGFQMPGTSSGGKDQNSQQANANQPSAGSQGNPVAGIGGGFGGNAGGGGFGSGGGAQGGTRPGGQVGGGGIPGTGGSTQPGGGGSSLPAGVSRIDIAHNDHTNHAYSGVNSPQKLDFLQALHPGYHAEYNKETNTVAFHHPDASGHDDPGHDHHQDAHDINPVTNPITSPDLESFAKADTGNESRDAEQMPPRIPEDSSQEQASQNA